MMRIRFIVFAISPPFENVRPIIAQAGVGGHRTKEPSCRAAGAILGSHYRALQQAEVPGEGGGLGARGGVQLMKDIGDMALDGMETDDQLVGDAEIAGPGGEETQYLDLAGRKRLAGLGD